MLKKKNKVFFKTLCNVSMPMKGKRIKSLYSFPNKVLLKPKFSGLLIVWITCIRYKKNKCKIFRNIWWYVSHLFLFNLEVFVQSCLSSLLLTIYDNISLVDTYQLVAKVVKCRLSLKEWFQLRQPPLRPMKYTEMSLLL